MCRLSPVHVGVAQLAHERIRTDHLFLTDSGAELGISAGELVDVDGDHAGVVVEPDEALVALALEHLVDHLQGVVLDLLDDVADAHVLGHARVEAE